LGNILGWNIIVSLNVSNTLALFVFALAESRVVSSVWVVGFSHEWVLLNVFESIVHQTTLASVVLLGAVNKVLL